MYVFTFSLLDLLKESGWTWSVLSGDMMLVCLIIYSFIAVWFVGGLSVFHYYLIFTNQVSHFLSTLKSIWLEKLRLSLYFCSKSSYSCSLEIRLDRFLARMFRYNK